MKNKNTGKSAGLKNLNPPMAPGTTLNPNGRPKGLRNFSTVIREMLEVKIIAPNNPITTDKRLAVRDIIILQLLKRAINGDLRAIETLLDRIEGKPLKKIEQETKDVTLKFDNQDKNI